VELLVWGKAARIPSFWVLGYIAVRIPQFSVLREEELVCEQEYSPPFRLYPLRPEIPLVEREFEKVGVQERFVIPGNLVCRVLS
jgi:hypothetical protein